MHHLRHASGICLAAGLFILAAGDGPAFATGTTGTTRQGIAQPPSAVSVVEARIASHPGTLSPMDVTGHKPEAESSVWLVRCGERWLQIMGRPRLTRWQLQPTAQDSVQGRGR